MTALRMLNRFAAIVALGVALAHAFALPSTTVLAQNETSADPVSANIEFIKTDGRRQYTKYDDSLGIILFEAKINGAETWAVLDTGSGATLIDRTLVSLLGLEMADTQVTGQLGGSQSLLKRTSQVTFEAKGQFIATGDFLVGDLSSATTQMNRSIGIVVGQDYLENLALVLDTRRKRLLFTGPGTKPSANAEYIELELNGSSIQGSIAGVPTIFQIDTTTTTPVNVLADSWAKYFSEDDTVSLDLTTNVSGKTIGGFGIEERKVDVGPIGITTTIRKLDEAREGVDAYLGYRFLQVGTILFNYPKDRVYIVPHKERKEETKPE